MKAHGLGYWIFTAAMLAYTYSLDRNTTGYHVAGGLWMLVLAFLAGDNLINFAAQAKKYYWLRWPLLAIVLTIGMVVGHHAASLGILHGNYAEICRVGGSP